MRSEGSSPDWLDRSMRARKQTGKFCMEMSAREISVVCDFGKNIWEVIGSTRLRTIIKLWAKHITEGRRECNEAANKLIGIFNASSHRPMLVGMIGDSELRSPSVRHPDSHVLILVVRNGQFVRHGSNSRTVRGQPAPRLSAKEFPFPTL